MMRLVPLYVFLALALLMGFMLLHAGAPSAPGMASDKRFPAITVTSLDGTKKWDESVLNGEVTLINFFASWCPPCEAEMPELVALKKRHPKLRLVGIAWNDESNALKKWLKQHGNPYDTLWFDQKGKATISLGIRGIPESFIIDRDGIERYRISGPVMKDDQELEDLLATLLNGKNDAR